MNEEMVGFAAGFIFIIVISFVFKTLLRKKKMRNDIRSGNYDERQILARGRACMAAYYVLLIFLTVIFLLDETGVTHLFMSSGGIWFGVCVSIAIFVIICVLKDAYTGLNDNLFTYIVITGLVGVFNICIGVSKIIENVPMIIDGKLSSELLNLESGVLLVIVCPFMIVKYILNKKAETE